MTTDALNRTENPIQSPWVTPGTWNPFKLNGTGATAATGGADAIAYYTGSSLGVSEIVIGTAGGGDGGCALHVDSSGNGYVFTAFDGNLHILRCDGAPNYAGDLTSSVVAVTFTPGDTWRMRRSGNFLIVSKNGVDQMTSTADTTYTGGQDGIFNFDGTFVIDSWSNGAVTVTASLGRDLSKVGPGISPLKRKQFTQRQLDVPAIVTTTVALTGQAVTVSAGNLAASTQYFGKSLVMGPGVSPDYTKVFAPKRFGYSSLVTDVTLALSGQPVTTSTGTLIPATSIAITGTSVTASAGTLTPNLNIALTGTAVAVSSGTLTPSNDTLVALTGQAVTVSSGTLVPASAIPLTGQAATASAGTLTALATGDITVALTGIAVTVTGGVLTAAGGDTASAFSGGFFYDFDAYSNQRKQKKRQLEEAEEGQEQIADVVEREIAELLQAQERKDAERKDFERLKTLASRYQQQIETDIQSERVTKALKAAQEKQTLIAYEILQREIERSLEEDEFALLMLLANE